jgi:hypothetical protein
MLRMFGYNSIEEVRELHAVDFAIPSEKEKNSVNHECSFEFGL